MKQILSVILVLLTMLSYGQINLEQSYDYSGTFIHLKNSGDKFYIMDIANNQCRIYNTNYTLWKTINLPVPANNYLYDIRFVSENLFTTTNELCLAYVYYIYDETNLYYTFNAKVIKENGTELLLVPGCQYLNVFTTASGGAKLTTFSYDYSIVLYTTTTNIYNLPGTVTSVNENVMTSNDDMSLPAFPNPAVSTITVPFQLPDEAIEGVLIFNDSNGKQLFKRTLQKSGDRIVLDVAGYPAGIYTYTINAINSTGLSMNGYRVKSGKIVLQ